MKLKHINYTVQDISDFDLMQIYRYTLNEYDIESIELIKNEYGKRKVDNPNLELYYPTPNREKIDIKASLANIQFNALAKPIKRLAAYIIDYIIVFFFAIPITYNKDIFNLDIFKEPTIIFFTTLLLGFLAIQGWLLSCRGQSLGKIILKIKIVKLNSGQNGGFITNVLIRSVLNTFLWCIPAYSFLDVSMIFGKFHKCIHDDIAGTVVIDVNKRLYPSGMIQNDSYLDNHKFKNKRVRNGVILIAGITIIGIFILLANVKTDYIQLAKENYDNANYIDTISYCDQALQNNLKDSNAILYKGKSLYQLEKNEEAILVLLEAEKQNIANEEIYLELGYNNYYLGKYNEALRCFTHATNINKKSSDAHLWKAYTHIELTQYDNAIKVIDDLMKFDANNSKAINAKGNAYFCKEDYAKSLQLYDIAINLDLTFTTAHINKIKSLYALQRYTDCFTQCEKTLAQFPNNTDVLWYMGDCYSQKENHQLAIDYYQKAIKIDPSIEGIVSAIGWEYFYMQDYAKANEYSEKTLQINTENQSALALKDSLVDAAKKESIRVTNFIQDNYLYHDKVENIDSELQEFALRDKVDKVDISRLVDKIRYKDDRYTFVLYGKDYEDFTSNELSNHIVSKPLEHNIHYIRINSFTLGIANEFRDYIEKINSPENQNLIIDLRDNPGGLAYPTNNILDLLLSKCITSYTIYRDGQIFTYESNENQIKFKHIYIYVNQNSASSSELLSLGLKKYLNNVTVIGTPTVGKGVGQITFENKEKKYIIFLVNHYWNVKEKNIMGDSIIPDITVKSDDPEEYFNAVNKAMK